MFFKKPKPAIPLIERTRLYSILDNGAWGQPFEAKDAVAALEKHYRACRKWTWLDYEIVYCNTTKEVLYVKCEHFPKTETYRMLMLWDKPTEPPKKI